jgi:ATP-binding cassette subfamily C (CFTR/MRP) protein 1
LVTIIYSKTQELQISSVEGSSASTLMSTDVERVSSILTAVHTLCATPLELIIAIILLERQLGAACVMPITLALGKFPSSVCLLISANVSTSGCSLISFWLSSRVGRKQGAWLAVIQKRLDTTAAMLG